MNSKNITELKELFREFRSINSAIVSDSQQLKELLGGSLAVFATAQPEFVLLRELNDAWGFPASEISKSYGQGLPTPSRYKGTQKMLPRWDVYKFLYASMSKYGLPCLQVDRGVLKVRRELNLGWVGAGVSRNSPVFGLLDAGSGRIHVDNSAPLIGDSVWVGLLPELQLEHDLFPGISALPASPIDAIRVLINELGYQEDVSDCFPDEGRPEVSKVDPRSSELRLEVDREHLALVAAKIAGGEAPYIRKCLWVAILAASFPWGERGLVDFINRLIVAEGGKPLLREAIYSRISLARSYLFLKAKWDDFGYSTLPQSKAVGDLLRRIPDGHLSAAWVYIDQCATAEGHKIPSDEDFLQGWKKYRRQLADEQRNSTEIDFTADLARVRDRKARGCRAKIGRHLNRKLEEIGIDGPEEALMAVLNDMGVSEDDAASICSSLIED